LNLLADQINQGDTIYVYLDQQSNAAGHGLGAGTTAGKPVSTLRRGPVKEPNKSPRGGVEQIIHQDFMPSSEWDTKNRIVFHVYLVRACDFKAITDFDAPPTPINAAAYERHNFNFDEKYIEPGMIQELVADGEEENGKNKNRQSQGQNVYELSAFDEDLLDNELSPQQAKHLSIRNFV
jgi:hypothetical protein